MLTGLVDLFLRGFNTGVFPGAGYHAMLGAKLLLFLAMVLHHCFQAFRYSPSMASLTAEAPIEAGSWPEPLLSYWKRWLVLLKINAVLGPIILLLGLGLGRT